MKNLFINLRDYWYNELLIQKGEDHTNQTHKFLFVVSFYLYYAAFTTVMAMLQWRLKIPFPAIFKTNFFFVLIGAVIINAPFYFLTKWLWAYLSDVPLTKNMTHDWLVSLRWMVGLFYILGAALLFLIPWGLMNLLD